MTEHETTVMLTMSGPSRSLLLLTYGGRIFMESCDHESGGAVFRFTIDDREIWFRPIDEERRANG
jgi:hypothetical protein